jgi:hypothetical protein
VEARLLGLQTALAEPIELLGTIPGDPQLENALQKHFNRWHLQGEWFQENDESLAEVGRILANPPQPKGLARGARRLKDPKHIVLAERIAGYLRGLYPQKPSHSVAADLNIPETTVRTWVQGNSLPSAELMNELWLTYGPTFIAAVLVPTPQWVKDCVEIERRHRVEAEIERLKAELASLEEKSAERAR